jgi:DNA-directed RNA polymerase subunit RPC12/RpoP
MTTKTTLFIGGLMNIIVTYFCEECMEMHTFDISNKYTGYFCPKCGTKMMYWSTGEIDPNTNKVVNSYREPERVSQNPGKPTTSEFHHLNPPTVTCPYCQSTNTKKISGLSKASSVALWGIFSQKVHKQWHCNNCGSDF